MKYLCSLNKWHLAVLISPKSLNPVVSRWGSWIPSPRNDLQPATCNQKSQECHQLVTKNSLETIFGHKWSVFYVFWETVCKQINLALQPIDVASRNTRMMISEQISFSESVVSEPWLGLDCIFSWGSNSTFFWSDWEFSDSEKWNDMEWHHWKGKTFLRICRKSGGAQMMLPCNVQVYPRVITGKMHFSNCFTFFSLWVKKQRTVFHIWICYFYLTHFSHSREFLLLYVSPVKVHFLNLNAALSCHWQNRCCSYFIHPANYLSLTVKLWVGANTLKKISPCVLHFLYLLIPPKTII